MAAVPPSVAKKLVDSLQTDLRTLSADCKRKYPPVKEASEAGLLKIRQIISKSHDLISGLLANSTEVIQPFVLGCDTKNPKIVQLCLTAIQKLVQYKAVSQAVAQQVVNALWVLMEAGIEDLKLLQTTLLLVTTSNVVQHDALAKILVLSLRLHFTKDSTIINTAAATVRQLVSSVFERVVAEDSTPAPDDLEPMSVESLKVGSRQAPKSLRPSAADAYLLFQDLCQLVNAHQPYWLTGMTEMTRTFCLELMEAVLTDYPIVFLNHPEFSFILKETVCTVIIKLFSPSVKHRPGVAPPASGGGAGSTDKPYFPIVMRLLRIVSVLIQHYYVLLVTECEIFLSLLVKFLDPERPPWQRTLVLEVLTRLCSQPTLVRNFCQCYDMKPHSTKVFRDIVNGLGAFIQSQFVNSAAHAQTTPTNLTKAPDIQGSPPSLVGGLPVGGGITPQSAFFYRNVWIPLVVNITGPLGSQKPVFLELSEKIEPPPVADGYALSLAFLCLLDVVYCVNALNEGQDSSGRGIAKETKTASSVTPVKEAVQETTSEVKALREELINSSWCGILAAFTLLLDASCDESATEAILKSVQVYTSLCGQLELSTPRDAFITALCKASLPPHYALTILNTHSNLQRVPASAHNTRSSSQEGSVTGQTEVIHGSQVVAVGTPLLTASLPLGAQQGPVMLTAKNIQCMRALLSLAHCHGGILGSAWHQVLTTLQILTMMTMSKTKETSDVDVVEQIQNTSSDTTSNSDKELPVRDDKQQPSTSLVMPSTSLVMPSTSQAMPSTSQATHDTPTSAAKKKFWVQTLVEGVGLWTFSR
ncbi:MON2-like protein [Lamellibrachia satsuma]|nr:MON2-like protein [Lamellibrachia satsuma]